MANRFDIREFARKHLETTRSVYLQSPERMFSEFKGEKENVNNYNGRQLLEMLQNADDAASKAKREKKVLIKLIEKTLIIANTGHPFSEEGLKSIFFSHLSPKEAQEQQIGKKGLGFRSILSWANKVTIKSHDLLVSFSQDNSKKFLDNLLKNKDFNREFKKLNKKGHLTPISTLVCPDLESAGIMPFEGIDSYDTIIQIDLNGEAMEDVKNQVENDIDSEVLLFLNHLLKIEIDLDGALSSFKKKVLSPKIIQIDNFNSDKVDRKKWNVHRLSGRFEDLDRPYNLCIAWNENLERKKDVIYSYFRTKVPISFKGILHGSFELNSDRNLIINDTEGYNQQLVQMLPELLAQTSELIAINESPNASYKPISFLDFQLNSIGHLISDYELKHNLKVAIRKRNIFPTIGNNYIKWGEKIEPAYYSEKEFAQYLSPEIFNDLLQFTHNKENEALIMSLNPREYAIEFVIKDIAQKREQLTEEAYAKLISVIHEKTNLQDELRKNPLFYDNNKQLLNFAKSIFLPNKGKYYNLPSSLGVQVISIKLANALLAETKTEGYTSLATKLSGYNIKEYKFTEVVEILIKHYNSSIASAEDIIELNQQLFNIYRSEENPEELWKGTPVPIPDKTGKTKLAWQLYFGKEYGNPLIEEIYHYNREKIVSSAKKLKIDYTKENELKKYLEWLGVNHFPRRVYKEGEQEYAEYVMKQFDFKNKIEDFHFKEGYAEFIKQRYGLFSNIKVISIDDIDNILRNNTSEKILKFIAEYLFLIKQIESNIEPDSSTISMEFQGMRNYRTIRGKLIKSYLKWKIENTPWLTTESNVKTSPGRCCTAAYINKDFSGLIEKPLLDNEVLKKNNINKDKLDYLLSIIGVHKTVNTFSTNMLYSILLKLPIIDTEGTKARTIYNQLAANFEEKLLEKLDRTDNFYIDFHTKGKVFCKNGDYIPIQIVNYINDKRYGETVIKQFNIIEIDKRRGKEKIKKIFGVAPLDRIELNIEGSPIAHKLNTLFENEMESFKPYVYVLRKEMDAGSEKNIIKETKFRLVSQLKLSLVLHESKRLIILTDYEYYYFKKRNIVYIKLPENIATIQDLKDDIHICGAIAEAFSAVLDVDSQRQQIRELFSKSNNSRDELLRTELDDNNLEKLSAAKQSLGVSSNLKFDFWKSFVRCFKGKKLVFKNETDNDLLDQLKFNFPSAAKIIVKVFNDINYQEINEEVSSQLILKLFKKTGIKISQFNQFYYPSVDIKELYEINFKRLLDGRRETFKSLYFEKCISNPFLKENFREQLNTYNSIKPNVVNEVDFDIEKDFNEQIKNKYSIEINKSELLSNIDVVYEKNLETLLNILDQSNNERHLLEQFIKENILVQSLLYFEDCISGIKELFYSWLGKDKTIKYGIPSIVKSRRISVGNEAVFYNDLNDLKIQLDSIISNESLKNIAAKNIKTKVIEIAESTPNHPNIGKNFIQKQRGTKEDLGFLGEYMVYRFLLETCVDKESVKWVSAFARECKTNLDGKDGWGYDIEYIPNGAKYPRYVEVKVIGWEDAFHITSNEVKYGEKYKMNYEIFLVRNLTEPTKVRIEKIQGLFDYKGKSFTNNDLFTVINDNYIIKFNRIE